MRGGTRQGWVWHGKAGVVRHGMARRSDARQCRQGVAWRGEAGIVAAMQVWRCVAWLGAAMQCRQGMAGQCGAGRGKAGAANGDGERPVASRKDGLHLNNAERHEKLIGE